MAKEGEKKNGREIRKDIQRLKKEGNYQEILEKYGVIKYRKAVPKKYKIDDIIQLLEKGKYEEIWRIYGNQDYKKWIKKYYKQKNKQRARHQYKELMLAATWKEKIEFFLKRRVVPFILSGTITIGGPAVGFAIVGGELARNDLKCKSEQEYAEQIEEYNKKLQKYVEDVKGLELDYFQTIMKVVDDMWETIEGYGTPKINAVGYLRLDMMEGGVGVCRNMADDVATKLNAINPKYNARLVSVYLDNEALRKYGLEMADIEMNIINSGHDNEQQQENENQNSNQNENKSEEYIGNHTVIAVDIPEKNITLIVDPTNSQLGVFIDGKIHMFFNDEGEGIRTMPLGQFVFFGLPETIDVLQTQVLSFLPTEYSLEELEEMYGTAAQNKALDEVRAKSKGDKSEGWRKSYFVDIREQGLQTGTGTQIGQEISYDTNMNISETGEQYNESTTTSMEEDKNEIR